MAIGMNVNSFSLNPSVAEKPITTRTKKQPSIHSVSYRIAGSRSTFFFHAKSKTRDLENDDYGMMVGSGNEW